MICAPDCAEYGHADWSGTVYPTHATELARQAALDGYDMVIALGGDGTVHEVVNGLMQVAEEKRPILGVVPLGSGNDFAHAVGVPDKADRALAHALHGEPSRVDVGLLVEEQGRREFFNNTLGIGFDAVVTIRSHRLPSPAWIPDVSHSGDPDHRLINFDPASLHIETDQESWDESTLMLTLCNGPREGGGFHVSPDAKIDDGILHYATVRKISRALMFRLNSRGDERHPWAL